MLSSSFRLKVAACSAHDSEQNRFLKNDSYERVLFNELIKMIHETAPNSLINECFQSVNCL